MKSTWVFVMSNLSVATTWRVNYRKCAQDAEKAALFDFNLTLPAIAVEFLLLMVALDKIYFTCWAS